MTDSQGPESLEALEAELDECLRQNNFFDALDIYEDIQASGQATTTHYYGMGLCYLKLRRRADAKETWVQAYGLDSSHEKVVEALNKNFPGWRKGHKKSVMATPTPKVVPPQPTQGPPSAGPHGTRPVVSGSPAAGAPPTAGGSRPHAAPQTPRPATPPRGPSARPSGGGPGGAVADSEINWDFVLHDAEEGLALEMERGSPYVAVPKSERGTDTAGNDKEEKAAVSADGSQSAAPASGTEAIDYEGSGGV